MNSQIRTYHDPLHKSIEINKNAPAECLAIELIDSPAFQRLRRIRQLGPAFLTFHGAESSRFTHSLGVFHIARKALNKLEKLDPAFTKKRALVYAASLLHDLGHGPLSHTGEEIFGIKHEQWSAKLIKENISIRNPLEKFQKGLADEVADLLLQSNNCSNPIKSIISSQLDCDRLDYLLRDSYSTGTNYGHLDLERILNALTLAPDGDLAINPKGLMAVEHYLVVRNLMYRSVYNHRINEVCNWILEKLIKTARQMGPKHIWADQIMSTWLWKTNEIDLDTFLGNDDIRTCYHFLRWSKEAPKPLANLCERFINRNLLKAVNINNLSNEKKLEVLSKARGLSSKFDLDPDFTCGLRTQSQSGYHPYKGGLRLWDGKKLQALEELSPLVKSLIKPSGASWLIYPKEIDETIKTYTNNLENK